MAAFLMRHKNNLRFFRNFRPQIAAKTADPENYEHLFQQINITADRFNIRADRASDLVQRNLAADLKSQRTRDI